MDTRHGVDISPSTSSKHLKYSQCMSCVQMDLRLMQNEKFFFFFFFLIVLHKGVFWTLSNVKDGASKSLTVFAKRLILDIWQGSEYASVTCYNRQAVGQVEFFQIPICLVPILVQCHISIPSGNVRKP